MKEGTGLARRLRTAASAMEGYFDSEELGNSMGAAADERPHVRKAIRDFLKRGELERVSRGLYRYAGRRREVPLEQREVMWRFLRARKVVTVHELQEIAGVCEISARDWLQALVRLGNVQRSGESYRLIDDPIEMPTGDARANKDRVSRDTPGALLVLSVLDDCVDKMRTAMREVLAVMDLSHDAIQRAIQEIKGEL